MGAAGVRWHGCPFLHLKYHPGVLMASGSRGIHDIDGAAQDDLRRRIAAAIHERAAVIVWDTVAIFPFSGAEVLEPEYCNRIGEVVVQLLVVGVRDAKID